MIDLRSDTVTQPSQTMRESAAAADTGDDVYGEDATVNRLQQRAADLLGTEAALFCPSGTMANQVAIRAHTSRGQELVLDRESHIFRVELAGAAQLSQLQTRPLEPDSGAVISAEQFRQNYVEADDHRAGTGLLALENTHNSRGGLAIEPAQIDALADECHAHGVPVHLDGARLCNAAVALDVSPERIAKSADSVMLSLSKGLGAPVGSIIAGSTEFIERAHRHRKLFGGGMRQAGIIAAPGIEALENVDQLHEDHANARRLASGLQTIEGLDVAEPDTNIVIADTTALGETAEGVVEKLAAAGVGSITTGRYRVRFVTHRDVDTADIETAIGSIRHAISSETTS